MAKLERLLNLMAALLETERPLTAEELRGRVEGYPGADASFRRAFERDKDDLREMGVPISLEAVPGADPPIDGYRIRKDEYYLDDPGLEPDELAALHLAANAVRVDSIAGAEAMRKLGGATKSGGNIEALASVPADARLSVLFGAVADRQPVSFDYRGEQREVEPSRLDFQRGRWYLTGFDRVRDDERHFRLDRLEGDVTLGEAGAFARTQTSRGLRRQPWELGDEPPTVARLHIDPDQAAWAKHHLDGIVETRDDGSIVLEVTVTNEAAFRAFALTFLDHAEILEPLELRASMVSWLEQLSKR